MILFNEIGPDVNIKGIILMNERMSDYRNKYFLLKNNDSYKMVMVRKFTAESSLFFHFTVNAVIGEWALHKLLVSNYADNKSPIGKFNEDFFTTPRTGQSGGGTQFFNHYCQADVESNPILVKQVQNWLFDALEKNDYIEEVVWNF